jgi:hypothetical protein
MPETHSQSPEHRLKSKLRLFKITTVVLAVVVVVLALDLSYPSILILINGQPAGQRLTGIDAPLSSAELSAINSAPNSYFEVAGKMLLNLSLSGESMQNNTYTGTVSVHNMNKYPPLIVGGKPSVVYIGAISCLYCAENRWAMALALSRFGNFTALYKGYSSFGDYDVPTLYWNVDNYTSNGSVEYGNRYSSSYINFFSAEYVSPISKGFSFVSSENPIGYFVKNAPNQSYKQAMEFMNGTGLFAGTPFTFWGTAINGGADAVVFGTPTSNQSEKLPPLSYMTHQQIINQFRDFNTTFAVEEYAAADVYVAETCPAIGNTAPVCSLPAITALESAMGLT